MVTLIYIIIIKIMMMTIIKAIIIIIEIIMILININSIYTNIDGATFYLWLYGCTYMIIEETC